MTKKIKKENKDITYEAKFNIDEFNKEITCNVGDKEIKIVVNPIIQFDKMVEIVHTIFNMAFDKDINSIEGYYPEFIDIAKKASIINYFSNFKLPKDINETWLILNYTNIYDNVYEVAKQSIEKIYKIVDEEIETKRNHLIYKGDLDLLTTKVAMLIDNFGEKFKDINIEDAVSVFKKLPALSENEVIKVILDDINEIDNKKE